MIEYINIPEYCPICNTKLIIKISNSGVKNLYCPNEKCSCRLANQIEHFCSKNHGLDIKGISRKTIEKLIEWGWINGLKDIFKLDEYKTEWVSKTGFGENSVRKILDSINAAKNNVPLESFISALGIPLVGKTIAKEIVKYYSTWNDFKSAVGGDWSEFDGFGPEISKAINNFDYTEADETAGMLKFQDISVKEELNATAAGLTFCITGKVSQWKNRDELKSYIESIGGKVVGTMSSKVNYLINNDSTSTSAKNVAAKKAGIPIITEAEFIDAFGQNS